MIEHALAARLDVVVVADRSADAPSLPPLEAALIAGAAPARQAEFARGRACARAALARLGHPVTALGRASSRAPAWPVGVVGSITHCPQLTAAAVTAATHRRALGIDVEPHAALPTDVIAAVVSASERGWLTTASTAIAWDRLLFSAKESVYKAWSTHSDRWLDFHDVALTVDAATATFTAAIAVPGPVTTIDGAFVVDRDLILTAAWT